MTQADTTDTGPAAATADGTTTSEAPEPTGQPEARSLLWWKQRAIENEAQAQWLVAEATAQRDQLAARVEAMQRHQVETLIGPKLHNSQDFWHYADLADVLDDDGNVSADKVNAVELPVYLKRSPTAPSAMVTSEHGPVDNGEKTPTFNDLLKAAAREGRGISTAT